MEKIRYRTEKENQGNIFEGLLVLSRDPLGHTCSELQPRAKGPEKESEPSNHNRGQEPRPN